jgi:hypothetical protein
VLVAMPGGPGVDWDSLLMPEVERHLTVVYVEPIGTGESGRLPPPHEYNRDAYQRGVSSEGYGVALVGGAFGLLIQAVSASRRLFGWVGG